MIGVYYEMWQKQLHDEGENQSDTANDESASTCSSIEDLLHKKKKPTPIDTEVIEIDNEEGTHAAQQNNLVSSPTQVETIELEGEDGNQADTAEGNNAEANAENTHNATGTASSSTSTNGANKSVKGNKKKKSKSKSKK